MWYFKISFYVNLHDNKLFNKWKRVDYFITVDVIVWKNDRYKTMMKGDDGDGWSSNSMMLWLVRRQNIDVIEWWT
jgi:hypothetical protein